MRLSILGIIVVVIVGICSHAEAGRPLSTEDAGVAGKNILQAELGIEYIKQDNEDKSYAFSVVPIFGLTEYLEYSVELPFAIMMRKESQDEGGMEDLTMVLKTLIWPEGEKIPAFLLRTDIKFANGDETEGLGSGDEDVAIKLVTTKNIGSLTLHGNIGYTFVGTAKDDTLSNYINYGVAVEYSIAKGLKAVGEIYGESDSHFDIGGFKHHTLNPLLGFTYELTKKIILDTAFRTAIDHEGTSEYSVIAGVSISL